MNSVAFNKVSNRHLSRRAYLYIRQSTMHQVLANSESTRRQYALQERALALGWSDEQIIVNDADLGCSAAASGRQGFQAMMGEVSLGNVGVVLGLEVSRLSRNSSDWHRLVEICAFTDTLIVDEDGVYNPNDFNDRMLLGIKGTMSEAELHFLKSRMTGGLFSCAERGELRIPLPAGFVYDAAGRVVLDPNKQVRQSIHHMFTVFEQSGSVRATLKHYQENDLRLPKYSSKGFSKCEAQWNVPNYGRLVRMLHNPRYAGAYCYGRTRARRRIDGGVEVRAVARSEWRVLIRDAHPGYISWQRYELNQQVIHDNLARSERRGAAREGTALLQGLAVCGKCGRFMTVHYSTTRAPTYRCEYRAVQHAASVCQSIAGKAIDEAVGELLIELVTPCHLEAAFSVESQLEQRASQIERQHQTSVEQAQYQAQLARQRFIRVDPDNRLVASTLEDEWNESLRQQQEAEEQLREFQQRSSTQLDEAQRRRIMQLAQNFAELWRHEGTPNRERKRMLRLLVEDVTLCKTDDGIQAGVRMRAGSVRQLPLPLPQPAHRKYRTGTVIVSEIDALLEHYTEDQSATILNENGYRSGRGKPFTKIIVRQICKSYNLKTRRQRLREAGLLTIREMSAKLSISKERLNRWRKAGKLRGHRYGDGYRILYELPSETEL